MVKTEKWKPQAVFKIHRQTLLRAILVFILYFPHLEQLLFVLQKILTCPQELKRWYPSEVMLSGVERAEGPAARDRVIPKGHTRITHRMALALTR